VSTVHTSFLAPYLCLVQERLSPLEPSRKQREAPHPSGQVALIHPSAWGVFSAIRMSRSPVRTSSPE
jgi:hypothetical protein